MERVSGGQVLGGKFTVNLGPGELAKIEAGEELPAEAVSVELNISGMSIAYISGMPPVLTNEAKLTVAGMQFAVDIPEGKIAAPSGQEIALSQGRFFIPDLRKDPQQGEITFTAAGTTPTVLELLDHEPLGYIQSVGLKPDFLGGTAEGGFTLTMPLLANLEFNQIKIKGAARLNDAIAANLIGNVDVAGGTLDVNLTEEAVEAKGEISIKGVPAELAWQRIFRAPDDRQPPIRVTANLDAAARDKLGMKINHLVQGPTPITLPDRAAWGRRAVGHEHAGRSHRRAAPLRRFGLDQAGRPCRNRPARHRTEGGRLDRSRKPQDPRRRHRHPGRDCARPRSAVSRSSISPIFRSTT